MRIPRKMRKPDPQPSTMKRARASTSLDDGGGSRVSPDAITPQQDPPVLDDEASVQPVVTVKRKKSRAYVLPDDEEESEGTQADAEYGGARPGTGWVNIDGRRRSVQSGSSMRRIEGDDARRHSLAV